MSQDVEMKAYQMVEEMLKERQPEDCSDHPMKNDPRCSCAMEFDHEIGVCNCNCDFE